MKVTEIIAKRIGDEFRDAIDDAFFMKFEKHVVTSFDFISGRVITILKDGGDFTPEQLTWLEAYGDGYGTAMNKVHNQ